MNKCPKMGEKVKAKEINSSHENIRSSDDLLSKKLMVSFKKPIKLLDVVLRANSK